MKQEHSLTTMFITFVLMFAIFSIPFWGAIFVIVVSAHILGAMGVF